MVKIWEVRTRYPESTNSSVRLIDGMMTAMRLDLHRIIFNSEIPVDAETRQMIKRAQEDLAIFRDGKPMDLLLIKDLGLKA